LFITLFITQKVFNIGPSEYYYDVGYYNNIGISMFANGHFSFQSMITDFRGYIFPLYLGICNQLDNMLNVSNSIHFISSFILTILLMVYLDFCKKIFKRNTIKGYTFWVSSLGPIVLLLVFFYGLVLYPLTDLYAALLCVVAGWFIYSAHKSKSLYKASLMYFFAGICSYAAYNIRTIYLLSLYCLVLVIVVMERKQIKRVFLAVFLFTIGAFICAIPQLIINFQRYAIISPWINNQNLFARQLFWGLQYSRFTGYVGSEIPAAMYYIDTTGKLLVDSFIENGGTLTIGNYIKLFFVYPLEYIAVIGKHIFNAFFILFPELYITDLHCSRYFYAIASLIIVFLFFVAVFINQGKTTTNEKLILFALLLPSIAILFGAVEERFLVLPYMLVYGYLCNFDFRILYAKRSKKNIVILAFLFVFFVATALSVESAILGSLEGYPLTFSGLM
jgi:hypothetical protein